TESGDEGGYDLGDGDPAGAGGGLHLVDQRLDRRLVEALTGGDDFRQGEETICARNGPSRIGLDHCPSSVRVRRWFRLSDGTGADGGGGRESNPPDRDARSHRF